jgi:hypothetical protein
MQANFLRDIALRCLVAARYCDDHTAQATFVAIAEEVTRKANEAEGLIPPVALRGKAPAQRPHPAQVSP